MNPTKAQLTTFAAIKATMAAHKNGRRIPDEVKEQAMALFREGLSAAVIGKEAGIHPRTIDRWLQAERANAQRADSSGVKPLVFEVDQAAARAHRQTRLLSLEVGDFVITIAPKMVG